MRAIFESIVKQHPNFTNLKINPERDGLGRKRT